ncbi:hypothetical protein BKA62DRAFT_456165 [Auriculariales sp. MPI-PUGE-AT-0066]|nr:hypothetical protein BKA62DRAFT_456165 [Auriculariales sp. MPI-PUGE-AT-0066]
MLPHMNSLISLKSLVPVTQIAMGAINPDDIRLIARLGHLRESANEAILSTVLCGAHAQSLQSLSVIMPRTHSAKTYWSRLLNDLSYRGLDELQLPNLIAIDLRTIYADCYSHSLACFISMCPRLRVLGIGAEDLRVTPAWYRSDATNRLVAILQATPPSTRSLIINCRNSNPASILEDLTPIIKRRLLEVDFTVCDSSY